MGVADTVPEAGAAAGRALAWEGAGMALLEVPTGGLLIGGAFFLAYQTFQRAGVL